MKLIAFAGVIFIVAYTPFTAALQLLKQFFDGQENPLHYSLATVTLATMWDTVVCLISFKIAFNDQVNIMLCLGESGDVHPACFYAVSAIYQPRAKADAFNIRAKSSARTRG
jgi:hypothetical protein